MARQRMPGSARSKSTVCIRPEPHEVAALEGYAAMWRCSLGEAALRLVRAGLAAPEGAALSERTQRVQQLLQKLGRDGVMAWCSKEWGLNRKQALALITEAEAA